MFWVTSRSGYKLVLAVEGVPTISVNYWAFLAPALAWLGGGLFVFRVACTVLDRGRRPLGAASPGGSASCPYKRTRPGPVRAVPAD